MSNRMDKICFLINFLKREMKKSKIIVFFSTCASVDFYTKLFSEYFKSEKEDLIFGLHGKLKSKKREKIINSYLNRTNGCLFATDVVSRGIDFDHIHFILQVDPP
jgi:superfamily II DNA/RNA helicase